MRPISLMATALLMALSASAVLADDTNRNKVTGPALYVVGYSHLDTEWCWNYPQVIREFIPNTLHENFAMFEKYPDYVFNWTGANRYRLMKEYYPADYAKLKQYVAAGRWFPNGSSLEELDVNNPDSESILRQVLYGNEFFQDEFGKSGVDFILPDCFGFPASLPSILHHAGVKGFSTQKLSWGSAVGIPFNLGVWKGPDGNGVVSALNGGSYDDDLEDDQSRDQKWIDRVNHDAIKIDYRYFGVGDRGGAPTEKAIKNLELSLHSGGPLKVIGGRGDQLFLDISPSQIKQLPTYQGDLELTQHSAGSLTSEAEMKRWNHKNELLADAAEKTSVVANWLGALPYDKARITDGWLRFLPGQFHDLMAGTALPQSYVYAWNDQAIAANEFSGIVTEGVGATVRAMNTLSYGTPVVVYNPLSTPREDVVESTVKFAGLVPKSLVAVGPDGKPTPVQIQSTEGKTAKVLFLAKIPAVGYAVYDVRPGEFKGKMSSLKLTKDLLENSRYRVKIDANGDISSIYDKLASKEILSKPARLAYVHHNPANWPAWNMDWSDAQKQPRAFVGGPVATKILENGPVRIALQITRESEGSSFTETIRLANGEPGNRVEIGQNINWRGKESALKATFPLTVSNPEATYNWGMGAIKRGNDDPKKYEVASHDWIDLTDTSGKYGVTILTGFKFGSNKPSDDELRLTLLYTPGTNGGYQHQGTQDWGHHDIWYGLAGHFGDWQTAGTEWHGLRLNQPPIAFQTDSHFGKAGRQLSFAKVSSRHIAITALKQAERSDEIIIRLQELAGKAAPSTRVAFAGPIVSAREVDGQEHTIGSAQISNGQLVYDAASFEPRAFAVKLAQAPVHLAAAKSTSIRLPFNLDGVSSWTGTTDGDFDGKGSTLPGELLPSSIVSNGITFQLGSTKDGAKNVLVPRGQTVSLPQGKGRTLYVLGASVDQDRNATFKLGATTKTVRFQKWDGFVGQWDTRLWDGPQPELTYGWDLHLAGLVPGYVKPAAVAWYADHKRLASGANDPYDFAYLFSYRVEIPDGAKTLTLPTDSKLRILAATVSENPNEVTVPTGPLFDTLPKVAGPGPSISPASGSFNDSIEVKVEQPMYWNAANPLRYTLDGTTPTLKSKAYAGPLWITRPTTIKVAAIQSNGTVGQIAVARLNVHDTIAPKVVSATALPNAPVVQITFTERVDIASAQDKRHYSLDGASVTSAKVSVDGKSVLLGLSSALGNTASLVINGVTDQAETPNKVSTDPVAVTVLQPVFESKPVAVFTGGRGTNKRVPELPVAAGASWTINQWVYLDEQPKDLTVLSGFGDGQDRNGAERFLIKSEGQILFWGSNIDIGAGTAFDLGRWQMVTISYDGTNIRIYKDGQLFKTEAAHLANASPTVRIAPQNAWGNGNRFKGKIAGFSIWNVALPEESIKALLPNTPN